MDETISQTITAFCQNTGLAKSTASELLNIHKSTLCRWATGKSTTSPWQWDLCKPIIQKLNAAHAEKGIYKQLVGKDQRQRLRILQDVLTELA